LLSQLGWCQQKTFAAKSVTSTGFASTGWTKVGERCLLGEMATIVNFFLIVFFTVPKSGSSIMLNLICLGLYLCLFALTIDSFFLLKNFSLSIVMIASQVADH